VKKEAAAQGLQVLQNVYQHEDSSFGIGAHEHSNAQQVGSVVHSKKTKIKQVNLQTSDSEDDLEVIVTASKDSSSQEYATSPGEHRRSRSDREASQKKLFSKSHRVTHKKSPHLAATQTSHAIQSI